MAARTPNPEITRSAIVSAAREQFGQHGFERTTIRSVAAAASVDPALVMHYFGSKNGLFAAAARLELEMPDLTGVEPAEVAGILVPVFVRMWGPEGPLLPLLRAAATNRSAADELLEMFTSHFASGIGAVARDRPAERAALIGSHLLGVAVARHIVGVPPLVDMDDETLIRWLTPVMADYLTRPAS